MIQKRFKFLLSSIGVLVLLLVISLLFCQPALVVEDSMEPTLSNGDWIIIQKIYKTPKLGDIVVFKKPYSGDFVVKRVILIENEAILIKDNWLISDFGKYYLTPRQLKQLNSITTVPQGAFFAAGDNKLNSEDSRDWGFITFEEISGKIIFRDKIKDIAE